MTGQKGGSATSRRAITPPLKWHIGGGKHYLASRIVARMPPCRHYVEPFAGGLSVLLARDPEGVSEVVNDLSGDLTNFWAVMRNPDAFARFYRWCEAAPFSEQLWRECRDWLAENAHDPARYIERACCWFVHCRQSLAGRMTGFAPLSKTRVRKGMNEQASAWLSAVEGLPAVHARLKRVVVLNRDALDVIRQQDGPNTLVYADPPYLHSTRATTGEYAYEMTADQHRALLETLAGMAGKFLLSGYRSDLYDGFAAEHEWTRHDFEIANHAAGGATKRRAVESVWCNFSGVS